ncbi:MAG: hypothetical protein HON62_03545 [Rhodospirillaceae bacterium]|nr:hypothetical protein [Rhodospirillaceae bacterium]
MNIIEAIDDPNLFAPWFKDRKTWSAWRVFLSALYGLPLNDHELTVFQECTGRSETPQGAAREAWLICGRRAGKSFNLALLAAYTALFRDWRPYLQPGERGTVMVIATDRRQARTIFRYIVALVRGVPMLAKKIERETADTIEFAGQVSIEVHTASFRTARGYTIIAALCDELAFWRSDESANPDVEIINALRPGMATVPGSILLCASSPYARKGALWSAHQRHFGKDGDPVLVWKAPTWTMNPTVPEDVLAAARDADPAHAAAEYGAQFRTDVESFINLESVMDCVETDLRETPPSDAVDFYVAFVDPSGGSHDSMTLAVAHREGDKVVLDAIRERRSPFNPTDVVEEFAATLKDYRISQVHGDRYAGEWPRDRFRSSGIAYETASLAKSGLYREMLPMINARSVRLLNNETLIRQLVDLERRTGRGGRDTIDHPPSGRDDVANAVAGVLVLSTESQRGPRIW